LVSTYKLKYRSNISLWFCSSIKQFYFLNNYFYFLKLSTQETTGNVIGGFPWIRWHQTFDIGYVPNHILPNVFMATTMDLRDDEERYKQIL
jgi:hypothetical protein